MPESMEGKSGRGESEPLANSLHVTRYYAPTSRIKSASTFSG
jgi:hypothetical protein